MDNLAPELLAVNNGVLNVLTGKIDSFSSKYYITNKLPHNYIENADCPNWKKFLNEVLPNTLQQQQLKEFIGSCLYKAIISETAFALLGRGANGKSILLAIIYHFIGKENISNLSLQVLSEDKFAAAETKGKLLNSSSDLSKKALSDTGYLKGAISGDPVQIHIKHVTGSETYNPYTKYMAAANFLPMPSSEEETVAWYRRWSILTLDQTFGGQKKRKRQELLKELKTTEEMSGLLNWAMEGLQELYKNGEITSKTDEEECKLLYRRNASAELAFFDDMVQVTDEADDWIETKVFYKSYVAYCRKQDPPKKTNNPSTFHKAVTEHLHGAYYYRNYRPNPQNRENQINVFQYVKVCDNGKPCNTCGFKDKCTKKKQNIQVILHPDSGYTGYTGYTFLEYKRKNSNNIEANNGDVDGKTTTVSIVEKTTKVQNMCSQRSQRSQENISLKNDAIPFLGYVSK